MPRRGSRNRLSPEELAAWQGLVRVTNRVTRRLDADLVREHRMPVTSYDVLIQLALAPGRRLPMTRLAEEVLMSPSGLTRVVDQLQREGLVRRERRPEDGRGFDAVLTDEGRQRLRVANADHLRRVRELVLDRLSDEQLGQLREIWAAIGPELSGIEPPGSA